MSDFKVKDPNEMTDEELVELYPTLHHAAKLSPNSFYTKAYLNDIKGQILKRMRGGK